MFTTESSELEIVVIGLLSRVVDRWLVRCWLPGWVAVAGWLAGWLAKWAWLAGWLAGWLTLPG